MLPEREVKREGRIEMLVHHPFPEPSIERLHLRARRDFGEEMPADLLALVERREPRLDSVELEDPPARVELDHAEGQRVELRCGQVVGRRHEILGVDRARGMRRHGKRTRITGSVFPAGA